MPNRSANRRLGRRSLLLAGFTLFLLVAAPAAALADPAVPTEYKSEVTGITPTADGVTVRVVGGDSFIEISVEEGHTVEVSGYFGEPYLLIEADGTVQENIRSPSRYVNEDRFGVSAVPPSADAAGAPEWEIVASAGHYAWHDHRTHWMALDRPPGIGGDEVQRIFDWEIPFTADGTERLLMGTLDFYPPPASLGPIAFGGLALAALVRWRRRRVRIVAIAGAAAAVVAVVLSGMEWLATPAVARAFPTAVLPPILALGAMLAALRLSATRRVTAVQLVVVGCVALAVFVFSTIDVFTKPLLPAALPDLAERILTSGVAWLTLACGGIAVTEMVTIASGAIPQTPQNP